MKLEITSSSYNPFFITVNEKQYEIGEITFYNDQGSVLHIDCGWFEDNNKFKDGLNIDLTCIRKLKQDFSLSCAYIIPMKPKYRWDKRYSRVHLYLPYNVFKWNIIRDSRHIDFTTNRVFFDQYENLTLGFKQEVNVRTEKIEENVTFLEKIRPLIALMSYDKCSISEYLMLENRQKIEEIIGS